MPLPFLIDENVDALYPAQLKRRLPDLRVWIVGDPGAPPRGTPDPELLCWCEAHGFILVTNNRKSMPRYLADHRSAGHPVPGIIWFAIGAPVGPTLEDLVLVAGVAREEDLRDQILYLPLG